MVQTKVLNKTEAFAVFLSKQKIKEKSAGEAELHRTCCLHFLRPLWQ